MSNITWNNEVKDFWVSEINKHQRAGNFDQSCRLKDGKGNFFACLMNSNQNNMLGVASKRLDIPFWLVDLSSTIFEHLPKEASERFPVELFESIPVDADLTDLFYRVILKRLEAIDARYYGALSVIRDALTNHSTVDWSVIWTITDNAATRASRVRDDHSMVLHLAHSITVHCKSQGSWGVYYMCDAVKRFAGSEGYWERERDVLLALLEEVSLEPVC